MYGDGLVKKFNQMGKKYWDKYLVNNYIDKNKNIVWNYISGNITSINDLLRAGLENNLNLEEIITSMDTTCKDKWNKDLYRVVDWDFMKNMFGITPKNIKNKLGFIMDDPAYMSTTKKFQNPWSDSFFDDELILHIHNNIVIDCININKMFEPYEIDCENQEEIILPRHTKLKIINYHKIYDDEENHAYYDTFSPNGTYIIDVEIDNDNTILEKYDLLYTLVTLNENEQANKLNSKIKYLISKALEKLEQQQRYQDAKLFAQKVKKTIQSNSRLKAILYCILIIIITMNVFSRKEVQTMANGEYSDGIDTVECTISNDGNVYVEEITDNKENKIQKETQKQELLAQTKFFNDVEELENIKFADDFKLSEAGKDFIKGFEKCSLTVYYATKSERTRKLLTVGYGHRIKKDDPQWLKELKEGDMITQEQADELFNKDIIYFEDEAKRLLLKNKNGINQARYYTQGFMDAFISMIFNSGAGNLQTTDFFHKLMRCSLDKETDTIKSNDYNFTISYVPRTLIKQKGKVLDGLVARRAQEYQMMKIQ